MVEKKTVEEEVEWDSERAGDLVERNVDILEGDVVTGDHEGEDDGEWKHLNEDMTGEIEFWYVGNTEKCKEVDSNERDETLEEGDEEWDVDGVDRIGEEGFVDKDHRDADEPVG